MPRSNPTDYPTAYDIATMLRDLYEKAFGSKPRGRFQISKKDFYVLAERKRIEPSIPEAVIREAYELGFVVTDLGESYSVVEASVMEGYRSVTARVLKEVVDHWKSDGAPPRKRSG